LHQLGRAAGLLDQQFLVQRLRRIQGQVQYFFLNGSVDLINLIHGLTLSVLNMRAARATHPANNGSRTPAASWD